jgi:hypothetical protein
MERTLKYDYEGKPFFYPLLGGVHDLGCARISGVGLGNSFFSYFHAFVLAKQHNGTLIQPAWPSFKIGPLLRGEARKRFYVGLFRPLEDELNGIAKYAVLGRHLLRHNKVLIKSGELRDQISDGLNLVGCSGFSFRLLNNHRKPIRNRLFAMIKEPISTGFEWARSNYIAIHVRMGDFAPPKDDFLSVGAVNNTRIPLSWYREIILQLRAKYPDSPILLISDGHQRELETLLTAGAQLRSTGSDTGDLLTLASASLLVGSNSTFSRWAAFLGDMPSIWPPIETQDDKPTSPDTEIAYVASGEASALPRWELS